MAWTFILTSGPCRNVGLFVSILSNVSEGMLRFFYDLIAGLFLFNISHVSNNVNPTSPERCGSAFGL